MSVKQQLLDLEEERWEQLSLLLNKVPDWEQPGLLEAWSIKDLLAHVASWHAVTVDRLESYCTTAVLPPAPANIDAFNAETYEATKDLPLHDVKAMSASSRHRFREQVDGLNEEDASKHERMIFGNAHGHYEEHIAQLETYFAKGNA
ncbi:MAG TPA: ClbS/DfsB family four-helix bundle protein [Actinomycetota bacterium]|nr:ClbS/DfsB family four-helix bundle protein [Actinomycetota bacterium]